MNTDEYTRADHLDGVLGLDDTGLVAQAYQEGWTAALAAARTALDGTGVAVPMSLDALWAWLNDSTPLRVHPRTADIVSDAVTGRVREETS